MFALAAVIAAAFGFVAEEVAKDPQEVFGLDALAWLLIAVALIAAHLLVGYVGPAIPWRRGNP